MMKKMNTSLHDYIESSGKTHLIFDFDETIVKLQLPWEKEFDAIRENLIALDTTIYENYRKHKLNNSEMINAYGLKYGNKARTIIIDAQTEFEKQSRHAYVKNDEIINFIVKFPEYTKLMWSSNSKPTVLAILQDLGIKDSFKKIINSEDVAFLKPYTDGFEKLYDPLVPKNKYVFIGDSKHDKQAAQNAGIDFYYIDYFNFTGKYWSAE